MFEPQTALVQVSEADDISMCNRALFPFRVFSTTGVRCRKHQSCNTDFTEVQFQHYFYLQGILRVKKDVKHCSEYSNP